MGECAFCRNRAIIRRNGISVCGNCLPMIVGAARVLHWDNYFADHPASISAVQSLDTGLKEFSPRIYFALEFPSIQDGFWNWQRVQQWRRVVKSEKEAD